MTVLAHSTNLLGLPSRVVSRPLFSSSVHPSKSAAFSVLRRRPASRNLQFCLISSHVNWRAGCRPLRLSASSAAAPAEEEEERPLVEDLRVPDAWLSPPNAKQESEWLKVALHKWLDDEYCPEPANEEISTVAARSFYESLMDQQSDLGVILLKMVQDLEYVSFQESFHGQFSSANAAIQLITSRIDCLTNI